MLMRIKIGNTIKYKDAKYHSKSKSNSCLLKREKRSESHILLERENHTM